MDEFVVIKILLKLQELQKKHDNMSSDIEYIFY